MIGFLKKLVKKISAAFLALRTARKGIVRAVTAAGAAFLALGLVGVAVFGYLVFQSGGLNSLTGMADGIGLIVSLVVLITGFYMK
jgi:hypothetical protein